MRIAALSDIHGNLPALDAVLDDVRQHDVDHIVNLGDILSGPLWPAETATRLMALDLPTIAGNHERQLLTIEPESMDASDAFAARRIDGATWRWLADLPPRHVLHDEILMVHGTPASDLHYLLETVTPAGSRAAEHEEVSKRIAGEPMRLILCGHTHIPRATRLSDGRLVVNPGSVGLQGYRSDWPYPHVAESGSPHARYALIEKRADGWHASLRAVDYDWEQAADKAAQEQRPDWAAPIRTGRVSA